MLGPLKHQLHFVLLWSVPATWVCLRRGDGKFLLIMDVLLLKLLSYSDITFYKCFSLRFSICANLLTKQILCIQRQLGSSFQSNKSRLVHFLVFCPIFSNFSQEVPSIESLDKQELSHCNIQLAFIDYVYRCVYFPTAIHGKTIFKWVYQHYILIVLNV